MINKIISILNKKVAVPIFLLVPMVMTILVFILYGLSFRSYKSLPPAVIQVLENGEELVRGNRRAPGMWWCLPNDLSLYPELQQNIIEAKKLGLMNSDSGSPRPVKESCLSHAKLVKLIYPTAYGQAIGVYRCEGADGDSRIGEEVSITNYKDDCQYTAYLTHWENFPVGKYTEVTTP